MLEADRGAAHRAAHHAEHCGQSEHNPVNGLRDEVSKHAQLADDQRQRDAVNHQRGAVEHCCALPASSQLSRRASLCLIRPHNHHQQSGQLLKQFLDLHAGVGGLLRLLDSRDPAGSATEDHR